MIRDIRKKMVILTGRMPFSPEVKTFASHVEKKDWIYRNMRLEGSSVSQEQLENLMDGQYLLGASVWEHLMTEKLERVLNKMYEFLSRGVDIDLKLINTFHNIIAGTNLDLGKGYRKRSVVITEYDYVPAMPAEIPQKMENLQAFIDEKSEIPKSSEECFMAAAEIHNRIISVYPYGDDDKILARVVMAYFLMIKGYPAVAADMDEEQYNTLVFGSLKTGDCKGLTDSMLKAVLERTDLMIQLTAY